MWLRGPAWVGLTGIRYNERFLSAFKATVRVRAWDKDRRTWWFPPEAAPLVEELLEAAGVVHDPWVEVGPVNGRPRGGGPRAVLGCTEDADLEVLQAAYRALAKKHHPDRGGDPEVMKLVNRAWDEVQRERG